MRENAAVSGPGRTEIRTTDQARWQGVSPGLRQRGWAGTQLSRDAPPIWPLEGAHWAAVRLVLELGSVCGCRSEQCRSEKIVRAEERYIIEVSGKGAGILVGAHGAYVFHAALPEARSLDQRVFRSLEQAEKNISQELTRKRKPA